MSLLYFYGKECPHCRIVEKHLSKLLFEEGIQAEWLEVWHNDENLKRAEVYDAKFHCDGVPFLVNTENDTVLCGEVTYKELLEWIKGKTQ